MINKIVWVSFGPDVCEEALNYAIYIAKTFGSKIYSLYIKPTTYHEEKLDSLSEDEKRKNIEWNEYTFKQKLKTIESFQNKIKNEEIESSNTILEGVPCLEILNFANEKSADLIVIDKGKNFHDECIVQKTTLHVVKHSKIPVLSINQTYEIKEFKNILVPTNIYNIYSKAFDFANIFSKILNSRIIHLNIQKKPGPKIPVEVTERMHGDAYFKLFKSQKRDKNIKSVVLDSVSITDGIIEYTNTHKIDMIILQTFCGKRDEIFHSNGRIAENIIQKTKCPVLTIKTTEEEIIYGK